MSQKKVVATIADKIALAELDRDIRATRRTALAMGGDTTETGRLGLAVVKSMEGARAAIAKRLEPEQPTS